MFSAALLQDSSARVANKKYYIPASLESLLTNKFLTANPAWGAVLIWIVIFRTLFHKQQIL